MSLTRLVPASVPSDCHSSFPCTPSSALKNSCPSRFPSHTGYPQPEWLPGQMSLTRVVPASVPSDRHSSGPCPPSSAGLKNSVSPTTVKERKYEMLLLLPGQISLSMVVPASVPSLVHSSW